MVKINNLFWVLIMLLNVVVSPCRGQNILIQQYDGNIHSEKISVVQNLYFASSNLILLLKDGSSNTFDLPSVRKIYFDSSSSVKENKTENLAISPNPASNTLQIQGIPQGSNVLYIYRSDGLLVFKQQVDHAESISVDLSMLSPGLYVVRIAGLTSIFIKQ